MTHLLTPVFWLALALAIADWVAVAKEQFKIRRVTKPGAMLALITWFSLLGHWRGPLVWYGLALVFSLAGDILLLLPYRFFLWGLAAFLVGHLSYIVGLNNSLPPLGWGSLVVLVLTGLIVFGIMRQIQRGLHNGSKNKMRMPMNAYGAAIGIMLFSALMTLFRREWLTTGSFLVSTGAVLFVISDTLLAYHRFVRPVRFGGVGIMVTYHTAQVLLATGALVMYA